MNKLILKQTLLFLLQSIAAGLAVAFILLQLFPQLLPVAGGQASLPASDTAGYGPVSYNRAVTLTAPSVVNVYANKILKQQPHPLLQDPIFRRFFGDQERNQQRNSNLGSGVIMNGEGYIVTNAHVVKGADEILVTLADGRQAPADIIGVDQETDLAVIRLTLDKLPVISLGDSSSLTVGDVVLAIGNPYNFGQTVTQGIVSATGRTSLGITTFEDFIQTDADINPGNSGGALVTATGQLIGINTAIITNTGGSQGIGLAIPINLVVDVMQALVENGRVVRGWLGIEAQVVPQDIVDAAGMSNSGILVAGILQNGPADLAGIMPGDILTSINGEPLFNPQHAIGMIAGFPPGTQIEISVLRGWEEMLVKTRVSQRPLPEAGGQGEP